MVCISIIVIKGECSPPALGAAPWVEYTMSQLKFALIIPFFIQFFIITYRTEHTVSTIHTS